MSRSEEEIELTTKQLVFVVSDAVGETCELVVRAASIQFHENAIETLRIPFVEDEQTIIRYREQDIPIPDDVRVRWARATSKVEGILRAMEEPMSLDSPIGDEDSSQLGDFIEDDEAVEPIDAAAREMLRDSIQDALGVLSERERGVLELRFGLVDGKAHTLEEVGQYFNVTRERIRQIEAKALRKLRHPTRSRHLRDFLR